MNKSGHHSAAKDKNVITQEKNIGIILIIVTGLLLSINLFLSLAVLTFKNEISVAYKLGHLVGDIMFFPLLIVLLFQLKKCFRNTRSQIKIFIWGTVLGMLINLAQIALSIKTTPL